MLARDRDHVLELRPGPGSRQELESAGWAEAYGPKLADRIAEAGAPRTLVLGVVDGRNTKLEARDALLRLLDRVLPGLRGPVGLGPSCGLELLPRDRARAKLENMVAIAREHAGRDGRPR